MKMKSIINEHWLDEINATRHVYSQHLSLVELFEQQVQKRPKEIAVCYRDQSWTFGELDDITNQFAVYLIDNYNLQIEDIVGVTLAKSDWQIIAILSVIKAGGAYLPIDNEYPLDRINYMLDDCQCKVNIDENEILKFQQSKDKYEGQVLNQKAKPENLVYIIYTSGSTGNPKGCMLEHRSLVNRLEWMWDYLKLDKTDVILQKTTFTFDVSVWEIFLPLCFGVKMVVCQKEDVYQNEKLIYLIEKHQVSTLHFVPTMFNQFIETLDNNKELRPRIGNIKRVITSGEALTVATLKKWYELTNITVENLYGPTEASIDVTFYSTSKNDIQVPIGKPIWNTQIYIVDEHLNLLEKGATGELCIGGIGLARGYINKPELTAEKFVKSPIGNENDYWYRTGDLAKFLPDGNIEFIGRKDFQVKIRGFRIEIGEIENNIEALDEVYQAIVTVTELNDAKELVAYFTGKGSEISNKIKEKLTKVLPSHMIPKYFVQLEEFPKNTSGKVNRKKLPEPTLKLNTKKNNGTETVLEQELLSICSNVLGLEKNQINSTDSFIESGGNSLQIIRLSSLLYKEYKINLDIPSFFNSPNVLELIRQISTQKTIQKNKIIPLENAENKPFYIASNSQSRMWFACINKSNMKGYFLPLVLEINGAIEEDIFLKTISDIVKRHESFRTTFHIENDKVVQKIHDEIELPVYFKNVNSIELDENWIQEEIDYILDYDFKLDKLPLFIIKLVRVSENKVYLFSVIHHLITDGWSAQIFESEFISIYHYYKKSEKKYPLRKLSYQYKDYSEWMEKKALSQSFDNDLNYWKAKLENYQASEIPKDNIVENDKKPGDYIIRIIRKEQLSAISSLEEELGVTRFMLLLTQFSLLIKKIIDKNEFFLSTAYAGRNHQEIESIIGNFTNVLLFKIAINEEDSFKEILKLVQCEVLETFSHAETPFDLIAEHAKLAKFKENAIPVGFTYNGRDYKKEMMTSFEEFSIKRVDTEIRNTPFKFWLYCNELNEDLEFIFTYNSDFYMKSTIEIFADYFMELIDMTTKDIFIKENQIRFLKDDNMQDALSFEIQF